MNFTVNTSTKRIVGSTTMDIGSIPAEVRIDFTLTDGTDPVIAEGKAFTLTIGTVSCTLYKTDEDTVSFRYIKFNETNVSSSASITMTMDGVEILSDTVTETYDIPGPDQVQADWSQENSSSVAYIKHKPSLATVATSGSYDDLTNKPTIPVQTQADWTESSSDSPSYIQNKPDLSTKLDAPATAGTAGQVLTMGSSSSAEWADPQGGGGDADTLQSLNGMLTMIESYAGTLSDYDFFHVTCVDDNGAFVTIYKTAGSDGMLNDAEYSYDRRIWKPFVQTPLWMQKGDRIWVRCDSTKFDMTSKLIDSTGDISIGGDMQSLISATLDHEKSVTGSKRISGLFNGLTHLVSIESGFAFPIGVTVMNAAFQGTSISGLPVGFKIPSGVTDLSYCFNGCQYLTSLPSGFEIPSSVTNMSTCFNPSWSSTVKITSIGDNVSINPGTDNEGGLKKNLVTSIGTGFSYKTAYTTSQASGQAVFPNATIGAGWSIYQYSDAQ